MEHSHYIQYCRSVEQLLPTDISQSDWFARGEAATILENMYIPAGVDTDYLQSVAEKITHEYHNPTPKKTLF